MNRIPAWESGDSRANMTMRPQMAPDAPTDPLMIRVVADDDENNDENDMKLEKRWEAAEAATPHPK